VGVEPGVVLVGGTDTVEAVRNFGLANPTVGSAQYTTTVAREAALPPPALRTSTVMSSG
jgi:hypothetical protein